MKKFTYCLIILSFTIFNLNAQIRDTISIGAGYSQQVWYSFETDRETKAANNTWDLAFSARTQRDAAIFVNPNVTAYKAIAKAADWATMKVDTATLSPIYNTDTTWLHGALNAYSDNLFNFGWGTYNIVSHNVVGDSVYVLKTPSGAWKKILIEKLAFDTSFFFKYADLDGQNEKSFEFKKKNFAGKLFGYFSFTTNNTLDREPLSKDWDLVFHRYIGLTPNPQTGNLESYPLTGALQNDGITVAKVKRDVSNNNTSGLSFQSKINTIGYDWKSFTNNVWKITDSTAYFIKTNSGKIYKIVFTGFGGSANGNMIFTREALLTSSIKNTEKSFASLAVYPNPATDGNITLVYDLGKGVQSFDFQLVSLSGQVVYNQKQAYTEGLNQLQLPRLNLTQGMYFVRIYWGKNVLTQKIFIQ